MKGFHVEEPALHLNLSNPVFHLVGHEHAMFSPHPKQEGLSLHEFEGKLHHPHISHPLQSFNKAPSLAEERSIHSWPECVYGGLCYPSAEFDNLGIHVLGNMVVPVSEKKKNHDEYVRRGEQHGGTMEGDGQGEDAVSGAPKKLSNFAYVDGANGYVDSEGEHHTCHAQASMPAPQIHGVKNDRMVGYNGLASNDANYSSSFQDSTAAPTKGDKHFGRFIEHMGSRGNYINDLQAPMAALACESPPGDNPFWRFLPSNTENHSMDLTSCDEFCMYEFKVRRCMRGRSHDWTECPFAHPGEKARRRDPRCFNYSGTACPDFRRGTCRKGDSCELSHGVFECWLHPARYRTQLCKDGKACKRRVCFFAHSQSQLRLVSPDTLLNNDQFPLKRPLSLSMESMAGYSDAPLKQPPLFTKQAHTLRHGPINGYGDNGFFDDFSPRSMSSFQANGVEDTMSSMSAFRHGLDHGHGASLERDFKNYASNNSCGQQGMSFEDFSVPFELNGDRYHSHGYFPVTNGLSAAENHEYECSNGHSYCHSSSPLSSSLDNSSLKADANFRSQLALANLKGSLDQLMSPTSTLVGHVLSPPQLSPPLSPAESPPMSPISSWSTALSRKIASRAGHPLPYDAFTQSPASAVDGTHVSLPTYLANSSNYGSSLHTSARGPSPLSATNNGDQKLDTDKPDAMQSATRTLSMEANSSAHDMAHMIAMLQQMELRHAAMADMKNRKRCPSLLQRMHSPKARSETGHGESWGGGLGLPTPRRHELAQGSIGELNANLAKEEMENPDLGWVNELVK